MCAVAGKGLFRGMGADELAAAGISTGGADHNRSFVTERLTVGHGVDPARLALALDPQTSGGLLAAVSDEALPLVESLLADGGHDWWRIGTVERGSAMALR